MARTFENTDGMTDTFETSDDTAALEFDSGWETTETFTSSDDTAALDLDSGWGTTETYTLDGGVMGWGWGAEIGATLSPGATNGDDTLYGTSADDVIHAGDGHDTLKGFGGADTLDGGPGIDTVFYGDSNVGVGVNLLLGQGFFGSAAGDRLSRIEHVYASAYDDVLTGDEGTNDLYGLGGNDNLYGLGGDDGLAGGDGNDMLEGGAGADYLEGGAGIDTIDYRNSPSFDGTANPGSIGVYVDLLLNYAYWGHASGDTFNGIENVAGSNYVDLLIGSDGANRLEGRYGNDNLDGRAGNDILDGGSGADILTGGAGDDHYYVDPVDFIQEAGGQGNDAVFASGSFTLTAGADIELLRTTNDAGTDVIDLTGNTSSNGIRGNDGSNILNGREGGDTLVGLGGQDSFLFDTALDAATNVDAITDFNVADDAIRLDDDIFSSDLLADNSVAGSQFVIGAAALDAGDRIIYNSATGAVYYDSDGTGAAAQIQFAQLNPGLALTNADFLVVA